MLTYEQLDEIKTRASKATAGPWDKVTPDDTRINSQSAEIAITLGNYETDWEKMEWDASFIAHARTDIPALIAALEASEAARVKAEQERNALKDALTNSCNLLENYIDTFGDMSGANRADLNDYRRALEAKP